MKTMKMKKVLIALDYNPTAQKVAETGFALAKAMGAEIILMHVVTDPVYYASTEYSPIMGYTGLMDPDQLLQNGIEGLRQASQHFLDKTKLHLEDDAIQTKVSEGETAESILSTAKTMHADVIVMGSHSRKWLDNILMGSVTGQVLHNTSIPLFIIPTKHKS